MSTSGSGAFRVRSVALAIEEEREIQEEVFKRFSQTVLGNSSDSPEGSNSEDESEGVPPPELDENSAAHAMTGDGFQIVEEEQLVPQWPKPEV
jgi:hypothetical protein